MTGLPAPVAPTRRGRFISLEGGEGTGKSTQAKRLADTLRGQGLSVIETRNPGGTEGADALRSLLVSGDIDWDPMAETLIHFAARKDHLAKVILPALDRGEWVICDRYMDSTMAYQGAAQGVGMDVVRNLHAYALGDVMPDLTLILDVPVDVGLGRAGKRIAAADEAEDRYERFGTGFHETLRKAFRQIAEAEPARCRLIDANQPLDGVTDAINAAVAPLLRDRQGAAGG